VPYGQAASRVTARSLAADLRAMDATLDLLDDRVAASLRIGRTDLRAMEIISRAGRALPSELASTLRLTTGAVTAVIDRLEAAGLVRRAADPHDRRKVRLELTSAGRDREQRVFAPLARDVVKALSAYTADELTLIAGFVAAVTEATNRAAARVGAASPSARSRR